MNHPRRALVLAPLAALALGLALQHPVAANAKSSPPSATSLRPFLTTVLLPVQAATPQQDKPSASDELPLPEGKGRDLTKRSCSKCHSTNTFAAQRHTREQWSSIVDNMVSKGLEATDDELDQITDYLAASFPPQEKKESSPSQ